MKKRTVLVAARYPIGVPKMTAPVETAPVEPTAPATPPAPAPPTPSPANMPQTSAAAAPTTEQPAESDSDTEAESARIAKLNKENATWRTKFRDAETATAALRLEQDAKDAELVELKDWKAKVAAILNPDANEPPDPAKLAEQLTAKDALLAKTEADYQAKIRDLTIKAALPQAASQAKADLNALGDSVTFMSTIAKLDPSSDTFTTDLASAVAEAMEANPRLKVDAPVAQTRKSGAEIPGRSGGSNQLTLEQVRGMKPADIDKARREGRLTSLGVGAG